MTPVTSPYTTNTTLEEIAQRLRGCRRILVLTHIKPDGDAVGSSMALVRALNLAGSWGTPSIPRARAWYFGPQPPWLSEMCGDSPFHVLSQNFTIEKGLDLMGGEPDAVVVTDTGSWSQTEPVGEFLAARRERNIIIDHHAKGDGDLASTRYIEVAAAAVCMPVAQLCALILGTPGTGGLPQPVAHAAYLGIATDTGWFKNSNVNAQALLAAAELMRAGADHVKLFHMTEQNSLGRVKLIARALSSLELHCDDRLAIMRVTRKDMLECGASPSDSGGITDYTQSISSVRVSAMLTESSPEDYNTNGVLTKISMRSKSIEPSVDVNAIAATMGGGGHVRAAGARHGGPLDETADILVAKIGAALLATQSGKS
jgi:phosphoesterase RecJ-like protein